MKKCIAMLLSALLMLSLAGTALAADSGSIEYNDLRYVSGDVNCDEEINAKDLVTLRKILIGSESPIREDTAHVSGNDSIGIKDLVRLKKYLSGQQVKLGSQ